MSMSSVPCSSSIRFLYWSFSFIDVDTLLAVAVDCLLLYHVGASQSRAYSNSSDEIGIRPDIPVEMSNLAGVVRLLKKEQDRLTRELRGIGAALAAFGKSYGKRTGTRKLSAAARARIAAAQRAGWAKVRANADKSTKVVPIRGKRTLSAAARRKIAAVQRARWAKQRTAKPKRTISAAGRKRI